MKLFELQNLILEEVEKQMGRKVKVYHVSSNSNIQVISGNYSPKFRKNGLFVTPSFRSIANSWASYVAGKSRFSHFKTEDERYSGEDKTYKNLTLYTLEIPEEILKKAEKEHWERYENVSALSPGKDLYGAWAWDTEIFIPEKFLPYLKIVGRETKNKRGFNHRNPRRAQKASNDVTYEYEPDGKLKKTVTHYPENLSLKRITSILDGKDEGLKLLSIKQLEDVIDSLEEFIEKNGEKISKPLQLIFHKKKYTDDWYSTATRNLSRTTERTLNEKQQEQAKKKLATALQIYGEKTRT